MAEMEMAQRLEQIMGDETAMAQIRQLAQSLGGADGGENEGELSSVDMPPSGGAGPDLGGIMNLLAGSGLLGGGNQGGNENVQLLKALQPFLSAKRRKRVNEAMRLMQLVEMLPLLQQSGLLQGLMGGDNDG